MLFAGQSNIDMGGTSANGGWAYASSVYTWTPTANSSTINVADIQNCLLGSGTLGGSGTTSNSGAGSVVVLTACASCNQTGNVTITSGITAATTSSTQLTFTVTAAGTVTLSNVINLLPFTNASTGYPGQM